MVTKFLLRIKGNEKKSCCFLMVIASGIESYDDDYNDGDDNCDDHEKVYVHQV